MAVKRAGTGSRGDRGLSKRGGWRNKSLRNALSDQELAILLLTLLFSRALRLLNLDKIFRPIEYGEQRRTDLNVRCNRIICFVAEACTLNERLGRLRFLVHSLLFSLFNLTLKLSVFLALLCMFLLAQRTLDKTKQNKTKTYCRSPVLQLRKVSS